MHMLKPNRVRQCLGCALVCIFFTHPYHAWSWSTEAHRAIALIAINRLQGTNTANRIQALLGDLTLDEIASCPDEVRQLEAQIIPQLDRYCAEVFPSSTPTGTEQWHFVNTPVADATTTATAVQAACNNVCVYVQIQNFLGILQNSSPSDVQDPAKRLADLQALSFVVHLVGDIHQPLHAAARNGDLGGNREFVNFSGTQNGSRPLSLHALWDTQIVAQIDSTDAGLAKDLQPEISKAAGETPSQPIDWAMQSYSYAATVAYKGIPNANGHQVVATLDQPYQDAAMAVVRLQIARAGVRLARALENALP